MWPWKGGRTDHFLTQLSKDICPSGCSLFPNSEGNKTLRPGNRFFWVLLQRKMASVDTSYAAFSGPWDSGNTELENSRVCLLWTTVSKLLVRAISPLGQLSKTCLSEYSVSHPPDCGQELRLQVSLYSDLIIPVSIPPCCRKKKNSILQEEPAEWCAWLAGREDIWVLVLSSCRFVSPSSRIAARSDLSSQLFPLLRSGSAVSYGGISMVEGKWDLLLIITICIRTVWADFFAPLTVYWLCS